MALPALAAGPVSFMLFPVKFDTGVEFWLYDAFIRVAIPIICLSMLFWNGVHPRDYGMGRILGKYTVTEFISVSFLCSLGFLFYVIVDAVARAVLDVAPSAKLAVGFGGAKPTIVAAVYFALAAAVFEEVFFRGVLAFAFLDKRTLVRVVLYVLTSSILFASAHVNSDLPGLVALAYMGVFAGVAYVLLQNLWPLVVAHFCTDLFVFAWWLAKA